ncbi:hypothetical protein F2P56_010823 [Juglans regia]|uniref:Cytochrome P450 714C2-like n=1 Tax=Juglans regia TaxID=51240 RepID=A0A834D0J8_JUGRE|nr:hypothetical protein F2P56_010823 [Juglans regia]
MEALQFDPAKIFVCLALLGFTGLLVRLYNALVVKPERLRSALRKQGITGPPPTLLLGNIREIKKARSTSVNVAPAGESPVSHNCASLLFPFFEQWRKTYGNLFVFSLGNTQILFINKPDIVREITTCTSLDLGKPSYQQKDRGVLLGQGILTSNGAIWAHQRKVFAPELYMEKVKGMMNLITESTITLLNSWKSRIETEDGTTTAVSATWCLMLLGSNQEWQDRVRAEVLDICRGGNPDADMLRKMKQLTMVIHESLRLYPPVPVVSREALKDMKFGDIDIPKGVNLWTLVLTSHTDPEIWGPDAYKFNPERFANGITGACSLPHLYMPFGVGPRVCLGQNLAMVELKILIALLVSNFSFSLSPKYSHAPALGLVIEPEHGVDLLVQKL